MRTFIIGKSYKLKNIKTKEVLTGKYSNKILSKARKAKGKPIQCTYISGFKFYSGRTLISWLRLSDLGLKWELV